MRSGRAQAYNSTKGPRAQGTKQNPWKTQAKPPGWLRSGLPTASGSEGTRPRLRATHAGSGGLALAAAAVAARPPIN